MYDVYHLFVWELVMSVVGQCLTNVCCFLFECTVIAHSCLEEEFKKLNLARLQSHFGLTLIYRLLKAVCPQTLVVKQQGIKTV